MDVQDAAALTTPDGGVRNIHNKNSDLLWSAVGYNVRYDGDTTQQTYTGKNMLNVPDGSQTNNGVTWIRKSGVCHGVGTLTGQTYSNMVGHIDLNLPAGYYTFSIEEALPSPLQIEFSTRDNNETRRNYRISAGATSTTLNFPNGLKWTGIGLVNGTIGQSVDVTIKNVQVEAGSSATSYEPYVGGIPAPNPDYPQDVNVVTGKQTVQITGKNLIDFKISNMTINKASVTENNGIFTMTSTQAGISRVTIPVSADLVVGKTYELSLYARARVSNGTNTYVKMREGASSGNWIDSTPNSYIIPVSNDFVKCTLTFTTTVAKPYIWFYLSPIQTSTTLADIDVKDVQIEETSYSTNYETYQGKTTIVDLRGKNLFDKSTIALGNNWNGSVGSTCYPFNSGQLTRAVVLAPVEPNTQYTIRLYESNWYLMQTIEVDSTYTILNTRGSSGAVGPDVTLNFKTTATTSYIGFKFKYGSAGTTNFTPSMLDELQLQIEEGSTATTYQPYHAPIKLCKIGDYQDYIYKGADGWYLHKETGETVLDGDENVAEMGTGISGVKRFSVNGPDDMKTNTNTSKKGFLFSDKFIELNNEQSYTGTMQGMLVRSNGDKQFVVNYYGVTTAATFKTWLSTNNVEVYYALATPTNTKITDTTITSQLDAIHDWLTRYDYYGAVTGNLPMIINRTGLT